MTPPAFMGGSAKALGLLARNDREDTLTKAKSSDDDELNESASTMQRPVPAQLAASPRPVPRSKASQQPTVRASVLPGDEDDEDDEEPLVTQALVRAEVMPPTLAMPTRGDSLGIDDNMTTPVGVKKLVRHVSPAVDPTPSPAPPRTIKTPMAMAISLEDETPALPPESGMTRVAPVAVPSSTTPPRAINPLAPVPFMQSAQSPKTKALTLPPHKLALLVSAFLLVAAIFIVITRSRNAAAYAAAQQQPGEAFSAFSPPVEVGQAQPLPVPPQLAPLPLPQAQLAPIPPARTERPVAGPRRTSRGAVRTTIPVHREQ